jgi:hypothetical protein
MITVYTRVEANFFKFYKMKCIRPICIFIIVDQFVAYNKKNMSQVYAFNCDILH